MHGEEKNIPLVLAKVIQIKRFMMPLSLTCDVYKFPIYTRFTNYIFCSHFDTFILNVFGDMGIGPMDKKNTQNPISKYAARAAGRFWSHMPHDTIGGNLCTFITQFSLKLNIIERDFLRHYCETITATSVHSRDQWRIRNQNETS